MTGKTTIRKEASCPETSTQRLRELAKDAKLAKLVAANPGTPPDVLLELSRSDDKAVRKACTSNANTPVEALLKLGTQFPEQLMENPVFDLLLLGHPGLFEELPTSTLNSLLKRDQVPVELIRWAWRHRSESTTMLSLLMNPNTPADIVEALCTSGNREIRHAAELHCSQKEPEWATAIRDDSDLESQPILRDFLVFGQETKWHQISDSPLRIGDGELRRRCLAFVPSEVKKVIASHWLMTRSKALLLLAHDHDKDVRKELAESCQVPAEILTMLARDRNYNVRHAVAGNDQTPVENLIKLANDPNRVVREGVAGNSQTPAELMSMLAVDPDKDVRQAVAGNRQAPIDVIKALTKDRIHGVREDAARNFKMADNDSRMLAMDPDKYVRQMVTKNNHASSKALTLLGEDPVDIVRMEVASNNNTPIEVLTQLAKDRIAVVRRRVARNSETPSEMLTVLATDPDNGVRTEVAGNSQTPSEVLAALAEDRVYDVRKRIAGNDNTPRPIASKLRDVFLNQICTAECQGSQPSPMRRFLMTLPQCPPNILAKNFRSLSWLERFAIAGNPSTPDAILERMAQEGNQLVRRAAADNLKRRSTAGEAPPAGTPTP